MTEAATKPSVILRGFHGGIVNRPDIALELAKIIFEAQRDETKSAVITELRAEDIGDRWSIAGAASSDPDFVTMTIRKLDGAVLSMTGGSPSALPTAHTAERFAATLVKAERGEDELNRQRPFSVMDGGANWTVTGSRNSNRAAAGPGRFHLNVQKNNARVLDISTEWVLPTPLEAQAMVRPPANRTQTD